MKFLAHEPIYVPRQVYKSLSKDLTKFWEDAHKLQAGLSDAIGCYIFSMRVNHYRYRPWYVGFTDTKPFKEACFAPDKLDYYHESLNVEKGIPFMTLIAKYSLDDQLVFPSETEHADIRLLHMLLIANCLNLNPLGLRNRKEIPLLQEMMVHGLLNTPEGPLTPSVEGFQRLIGGDHWETYHRNSPPPSRAMLGK